MNLENSVKTRSCLNEKKTKRFSLNQIGLNFADEAEAEIFQQTVEAKLSERRQRRERRQNSRRQQGGNSGHSNGATKHGVWNGVGDGGVKTAGVPPLQAVQTNRRDQGGQGGKKSLSLNHDTMLDRA